MQVGKDNGRVEVVELLRPQAHTASANSSGVDLSKYRRAFILITAGVVTDGTHALKTQTATAVAGTYSDDVINLDAFTSLTTTTDEQVYKIDLDLEALDARYARLATTVTGATAGGIYGAVLVGVLKKV